MESRAVAGPSRDPLQDSQDLRRIFALLAHGRRGVIAASLLGGVLAALAATAYVVLRPVGYTATTNLLAFDTTMQLSGPDAVVTQVMIENSQIQSDIELAKSSSVIGAAIDALGAVNVEAALPSPASGLNPLAATADGSETPAKESTVLQPGDVVKVIPPPLGGELDLGALTLPPSLPQ